MFFSPLEQFDTVLLIPFFFYIDFSFTSILLPLVIVLLFLFGIYFLNFKIFSLIPGFWQLTFENLYMFILNLVDQQIGPKGYIYFPLIFTLFFFILSCNLLSMTPFGIALTSHIIMILFLSLSLGLFNFFLGLFINGLPFLQLFIPQCPFILLPFLILIEIFSYVLRNFSLAIRLAANILAGHTLVFIISSFLVNAFSLKYFFLFSSVFAIFFAILMLEVGVSCLQAYVFVTLFSIFLSDSVNGPSH